MALPDYTVWFRGFPACPCLAKWLPVYEAELQRRGALAGELRIFQLIGGAAASAGTHSKGGAADITDLVGDTDVWVARQMGADAAWARTAAQGFTPHIHLVLRGCPHNWPARYQIDAVDDGFNGLGAGGRGAPDDGPRPLSGRTWRQGLEWAKQQQEEEMAQYEEQLDRIEGTAATILKRIDGVLRTKLSRINTRLERVNSQLRDLRTKGATAEQVAAIADEVAAIHAELAAEGDDSPRG